MHYSLAIHPSEAILSLVKTMKELLASDIDWFHSKNSVGHITICEFKASEKRIQIIKKNLKQLCDTIDPLEIILDSFDSYPNGTFFIAPNPSSKESLKPIMKRVQDVIRILNIKKSNDPHLSIARKLSPEKLEIATHLFTEIKEIFLCESIVLRQFDENIKQFSVIEKYTFNSYPPLPELIQGSLF
jgi:hypothetical protein